MIGLAAASALVLVLQAAPAAAAPAPFSARVSLAHATLVSKGGTPRGIIAPIGDRLDLNIDIDAPGTIEAVQPRLEERLGDFDVLSIDSTPVVRGEYGWRQSWRVTLAAFDKGEARVPRFALDYTAAGGQTLAYWIEPGLKATITSPAVTPDMPLRPMVGRLSPPPPSPWPRILLIGGVLSVVVGVLSIPGIRWWLRALARRRQLAFFKQLQRELAKLGEAPARTAEEARAAYTRAAEILRLGVGRIAPGQTAALPSPELANHLARTGADGSRLAGRLRVSLSAVDAVRFGNAVPAAPRHTATLGEAGGVVQSMGESAVKHRQPKVKAS